MSEFWVSNGRVFCDFCKCWYADNKVEKETHERGSKHMMAKAKALAGIRKLSEWNAKEQDKIEGYLAEADRAAKEAYKRDLREAGVTAISAKRQKRDEDRLEKKRLDDLDRRLECKYWHLAKDPQGTEYYWHSKTRETRWKPPPFWLEEKRQEEAEFKEAQESGEAVEKVEENKIDGNITMSTSTTITKTVKATFKKSGKGLFKSAAGTNSTFNATTSGIAQKMTAISANTTFKGADDDNKGYKRSADVAYGGWRPSTAVKGAEEETKTEFDNDLGLPEFADAFFENEAQDKEKYKGFTHKDDRFQVGGEAKLTKPIGNDDDDDNDQGDNKPVIMKKKKFGGQVRKRLDN